MRQTQALRVMMDGANVFLTGAPGAGKTYVLNQFIKRAERAGLKVAVTASTGIAASHIGGTTIHAWSGLGILDSLSRDDIKRLSGQDRLIKRYNATDVLVIDEISMLHGARLDMVNQLAKELRSSDQPFGGMQVILVGDFFQLPPVSRGSNSFDFVYQSAAWADLRPSICYLTEQHRQQGSDQLLAFLEAMRSNTLDDSHRELLRGRLSQYAEESVALTRLYAHNVDVEAINQRHLAALEGETHYYERQGKGNKAKIEQLGKGLLAPEILELKTGAEVMFVANNFNAGYVNGTRGQVVDFDDGIPVVELLNGRQLYVESHSWSLSEDGRVRAEISQLPLRLAWAITIHKSQGMSLDAAEVDLGRAFTPGMGYVALSRVRSLEGLYLKAVNGMALTMHPEIHDFDRQLRQASAELAAATEDIEPETSSSPASDQIQAPDSELLAKLKTWRTRRAEADAVPAYIIAHNTTLEAVAAKPPKTSQQLMALPGFGPKKVDAYGADLLAIIAAHRAPDD